MLGQEGMPPPPPPLLFLKSYFARNVFLEICLCVTLQGIQTFFGSCTPKFLLGALKWGILESSWVEKIAST